MNTPTMICSNNHLPSELPPIIRIDRGEQFRCQNVYAKKRCPACSKAGKPAVVRDTENLYVGICITCGAEVDMTCDRKQFIGKLGSGTAIELKCQRCKKMCRIEKL